MDNDELEKLVHLCNSNDVDTKISAVSKLQTAFEAGIEIPDKDGVINALKSCLRTSNQHLSNAALSALPPLLPLLITTNPAFAPPQNPAPSLSTSTSSIPSSSTVDAYTLRQVIHAFLPTGGIIDRLGDARDKARDKARETLVILGGLAFRSGGIGSALVSSKSRDGKGPETPLMVFEKFLREGGLSSKVWRVREQSILVLVHIRRAHHLFPIRPYLPLLVAALEDGDAHVRECARESVVEIFTGPGVTDGARADLKAAMTKKGVRKGIIESVLSRLVPGSDPMGASHFQSEGSENGEGSEKGKEYVPPSMMLQGKKPSAGPTAGPSAMTTTSQISPTETSRPASRAAANPSSDTAGTSAADVRAVYITSARDMENEFSKMAKPFEGKETEHNWSAREQAILRVRGMLKGDVHLRYMESFLACLKDGFIQWSLKALASLRTTVSANTCSMYTDLSVALGSALDPFCEPILTNLLKMAGFTKKITAQQSQASVTAILTNCSAQPRIVIPLLWHTVQEKIIQARAFVVSHVKTYLEVHGARAKPAIDNNGGSDLLEKMVRKSLADASPAVRESARVCFWVFLRVWPERGQAILESLDNTARKQLEKVCPDPNAATVVIPSAPIPKGKKASVAAVIAASRAKAKAIATAPPTLRHQATSTSHAARATSPPMRRNPPSIMLKTSTGPRPASPSSPLSQGSGSPPSSPQSRILSKPAPKALTVTPKPRSTVDPTKSTPASNVAPVTLVRRTSSPLASTQTSGGVSRAALQTPLPASPGRSLPVGTLRKGPRVAAPGIPRPSVMMTYEMSGEEDLLMASAIPVPEDTDSDMGDSVDLLSFSAAFETYPPPAPGSNSQAPSSPKSTSGGLLSPASYNPLSPVGPPQAVVEDALRARAEQAESAAERLLELVEPEEETSNHPTIPTSLLVGSRAQPPKAPKGAPIPAPIQTTLSRPPPATPPNRNTVILKQAAMFKNSPPQNGKSPSLMDLLKDRKDETGWWLKRMNLIQQGTPLKGVKPSERIQELQGYISSLESGVAGKKTLQKLALLCAENPAAEPMSSPYSAEYSTPSPFAPPARSLPSLKSDMWAKDKNFDRMFKALMNYMHPSLDEDDIEYGLIIIWEILNHQAPYIDGREADVFSLLLRIRYCDRSNVLEATNTIRDAMTTRIEPVYGLTTMHASLREFQSTALPEESTPEVKAATYAFGLNALGKFILRLPSEVLEDELPRLRQTLTSALNDQDWLIIRESAAAAIIAAQLVLQDATHLFTLLDGLADEKKNLLTYLFERHTVRGTTGTAGLGSTVNSRTERLEKEMNRLDTKTSTPSRIMAAS